MVELVYNVYVSVCVCSPSLSRIPIHVQVDKCLPIDWLTCYPIRWVVICLIVSHHRLFMRIISSSISRVKDILRKHKRISIYHNYSIVNRCDEFLPIQRLFIFCWSRSIPLRSQIFLSMSLICIYSLIRADMDYCIHKCGLFDLWRKWENMRKGRITDCECT